MAKQKTKEWIVLERGSDEYILQCHKAKFFMSWLSDWIKRGEFETQEKAEAAVERFRSQTGERYIHRVVNKNEQSR